MNKRTLFPILGALVVVIAAIVLSFTISSAPTAPSNPPDRQASETSLPARQSDQNALPGLEQPNK